LDGELDVSNRLIDSAIGMYEDNTLRYIPWSEATKRELELRGEKKDRAWIPDASGIIKEKVVSEFGSADVSTDLRMSFALKRRGLALDMGDVMSYEKHDLLVNKLIEAYFKEPLPGYARVSLAQLARADVEAFRLLAKKVVGGIKRDSANERPCDKAIVQVLEHTDFLTALQCMPATTNSQNQSANKRSQGNEENEDEPKKKKPRLSQRQRKAAAAAEAKAAAAKGKGKGTVKMPQGLIGKHNVTQDGKRICYAYNLSGCRDAEAGGQCAKGWHVCCEPGCYAPHSLSAHPR